MLGVMILVMVMSVFNGFQHEIKKTLNAVGGDVIVRNTEGIMYNWESIEQTLLKMPFVEAVSPYTEGVVVFQYKNRPAYPLVRGVDVQTSDKVVDFSKFIEQGSLQDLDDETVIISSGIARTTGAKVGSKVDIFTPLMLQKMKAEEILLPRELEVVGIFHSGYNEADKNTILTSMRTMQDLYELGNGVAGLTVALKKDAQVEHATHAINQALGMPNHAFSWMEANESLFFVLKMEKSMMFFIILFVIIVASFSITSSLMTTVIRKTREIGLLSALGGRTRHIALTFCAQGLIIGICGTVLGVCFALWALAYRNEIVHGIANAFNRDQVISSFYQFSDMPSQVLLSDVLIVAVFSIIIATLAGVIPALRAAKMKPSEALRSE